MYLVLIDMKTQTATRYEGRKSKEVAIITAALSPKDIEDFRTMPDEPLIDENPDVA